MPFDLDKNVDLSRAKPVTLGQREFKVAPLTLRMIIAAAEMEPALKSASTPVEQINRLTDFVMLGLARTYPTLVRDDLLDGEITVEQLKAACDVVILQAGGKKEAAAAGEPKATSDQAISDGEGSSPSSALN